MATPGSCFIFASRRSRTMARLCGCWFVWLATNAVLLAVEPRAQPLIAVDGHEAEYCLKVLGEGVVDIVQLVTLAGQPERAIAGESLIRTSRVPAAFLHSRCGECDVSGFWRERLAQQGTRVVQVKRSAACRGARETDSLVLRQAFAVLVDLCPESKAVLEQRFAIESARKSSANWRGIPLANH
ncbi:hypothetical protein ETAA8_21290 [Anatilimnocola aggregata]|uniref:Uncharacterized protein n=1 Tax=Anatilimnocola aggregata TaxID=2528021 RepID=A0A517Y9Y0_9BACT|nr:hypothetical protein ETAA8_21290 [Anatilimnocola aggregata]